jgi:hypothetical protein
MIIGSALAMFSFVFMRIFFASKAVPSRDAEDQRLQAAVPVQSTEPR